MAPADSSDDGSTGGEPVFHVDGDLVPADEARVSVQDRGFAYGDAAFETLRAYGGEIFEWDAHAGRLARTCETLRLEHELDDGELRRRIDETLAANDLADAYVKLSISRGVQPGTLAPRPAVDPTVVVITKPLPRGGEGGESVWDGPADVRVVETRRVPDAAIPAAAKTHNYLNGILARLELDGEDEALMLDETGSLTEGTVSNLFVLRDGALRTPSLEGPVLPGVTRAVVIDLAEAAGVPVETGRYGPDRLRAADEAFLTNTTWEVRPIASVDGEVVGGGETPGPVTETLAARFDELVEARHY